MFVARLPSTQERRGAHHMSRNGFDIERLIDDLKRSARGTYEMSGPWIEGV